MSDAVAMWLGQAGRHPLLTPAQEIGFGHQVRAWLDHEGGPDAAPPRVQRAGRRAKERMILGNLRLVASTARRYRKRLRNRGLSFEDLLQEGCLGLNRAIEKFDPTTGYKLSTYATWWIQQSVARAIELHEGSVRLPCNVLQLANRWRYRPAGQTIEAFAEVQGRSVEAVKLDLERAARVESMASLDQQARQVDGDGAALVDLIAAPMVDPLDGFDHQLAVELLEGVLPADLHMVERVAVLGERVIDLAREQGVSRQTTVGRISAAKARLATVAGDEIRGLVA